MNNKKVIHFQCFIFFHNLIFMGKYIHFIFEKNLVNSFCVCVCVCVCACVQWECSICNKANVASLQEDQGL